MFFRINNAPFTKDAYHILWVVSLFFLLIRMCSSKTVIILMEPKGSRGGSQQFCALDTSGTVQ